MKRKVKLIVIISMLVLFVLGGFSMVFVGSPTTKKENVIQKINQKEKHVVVIMSKTCEYCSKLEQEIATRPNLKEKVTYLYQEELSLGAKNQLLEKGFILKGTPESYVMENGTIQKVIKGFSLTKVNELEIAIKGE